MDSLKYNEISKARYIYRSCNLKFKKKGFFAFINWSFRRYRSIWRFSVHSSFINFWALNIIYSSRIWFLNKIYSLWNWVLFRFQRKINDKEEYISKTQNRCSFILLFISVIQVLSLFILSVNKFSIKSIYWITIDHKILRNSL